MHPVHVSIRWSRKKHLSGKKPSQELVPCGKMVLAKQLSTDPVRRMNPRYKFGNWLDSAECFTGNADGVFRSELVKSEDWNRRAGVTKKPSSA